MNASVATGVLGGSIGKVERLDFSARKGVGVCYEMVASSLSWALGKQSQAVFVLGHMRSGSSLLSHILASHDEIMGYGETHLFYSSPQDFSHLIGKVSRRERILLARRYCFDKILHDRYLDNEQILVDGDAKVIFLLREPLPSIKSMVAAFPDWFGSVEEGDLTVKKAIDYYSQRLKTLSRSFLYLHGRVPTFCLTYADLVSEPSETLERLTAFLELRRPLPLGYKLRRSTGSNAGDRGPKIRSGVIDPVPRAHNVDVGDRALGSAIALFRDCEEIMVGQC